MSEFVLECRGLKKSYGSGDEPVVLFDGLDFALSQGTAVAIVGESGAGKTTLLHLAATLERPDAGDIIIAGASTAKLSEKELAPLRSRSLGMVFQFHFLLKEFSVLENTALPAWLAGTPRREAWERAGYLLKQVGLDHRRGHFPNQLSGGERQRAALARALINDPQLVLADEPTGNLDVRHSRAVQDLLLELVHLEGKSLLLVTHDLDFARRTGTVLRLHEGRLVQE